MGQFSYDHHSDKTPIRPENLDTEQHPVRHAPKSGSQTILALQKTHGNAHVTRMIQGKAPPKVQPSGKPGVVRRSIPLLQDKDPAPADTTPLKDWHTLTTSVQGGTPPAVDVHQILLTYQKLSEGWKSGMNDVAQASANAYSTDPVSEIAYGPTVTLKGTETPEPSSETIEMGEDTTSLATLPPSPYDTMTLFTMGKTFDASSKPLKPGEKMQERKKDFKKGITLEDARDKRIDTSEAIRSDKREFNTKKKRVGQTVKRGTKMTATLLSRKGPGGSDATKGLYSKLYGNVVEGHLLNAYLHGSAEYENLAPFRSGLNGVHKNQVEEPLKKMIFSQGGIFTYTVTVLDGSSSEEDGFFPRGIQCDVVEIEANKTPTVDGYEQHVQIAQDGTVTSTGGTQNTTGAPGKNDQMFLGIGDSTDPRDVALATVWDNLRFPWRPDYGYTVQQVLQTAYAAIRAYERTAGRIGTKPLLALPSTKVTYTTGTVYDSEQDAVTVGTKMVADPLSMRPPGTNADAQTDAGTDVETFGFEPEVPWGGGLVGGHLLNHHLHGPGVEANLAPMTTSLNQQFERDVEGPLKRMVLTEGKVVKFTVEMTGEHDEDINGYTGLPAQLEYEYQVYTPKTTGNPNLETIGGWNLNGASEAGALFNNKGTGGATNED